MSNGHLTREGRIEYYLGEMPNQLKKERDKSNYYENVGYLNEDPLYNIPLKRLFVSTGNSDRGFYYRRGDMSSDGVHPYTLVKNRYRLDKSTILRCLNTNRHWGLYYQRPRDIPFFRKRSIVFWRGTTTGFLSQPGNRFHCVGCWFNKNPKIDVGFSHICQGKVGWRRYVKGRCGIPCFLQYKYLLSISGNDKDSGLNWKLNSNSLVMMTRPRVSSWLMESQLIPNYHYILLKDDYSDLWAKWVWCERHPRKCMEIIANAHRFMAQFKDIGVETEIEKEVIRRYFQCLDGTLEMRENVDS